MILSIPLKIETIFNRGTHFVVFCCNSVPFSSLTDILYIVNNSNQWLHTWETPPMHYMLADDRNLWTNAISDHYDQAAVELDGSDWIELKVPIAPIEKVFPVFYSLISKWYYTPKVSIWNTGIRRNKQVYISIKIPVKSGLIMDYAYIHIPYISCHISCHVIYHVIHHVMSYIMSCHTSCHVICHVMTCHAMS